MPGAIHRLRIQSMHLFPTWFKQFPETVSRAVPGPGLMHAPVPLIDAREAYDL